jgi:ubiquinone/menaquinone biosynthesis C-methylase UbiE
MFAFVLIHFGNKIKYLELELYFLNMLRQNTNHDIIYMYSITDTPINYVNLIKNYCTKTISYDDTNITFNISNFKSEYSHFNTLRTCNFIFAYQLIDYQKICIIESDMIIMKNIDKIFKLKTPSALYHNKQSPLQSNKKYHVNVDDPNNSIINGGVMLLSPNINTFNKAINIIPIIIKNNCPWPNESLFLYINPMFYNLPIKYNYHLYFKHTIDNINIYIYHFNSTEYKPLNIIKDNYIEKYKHKNKINVIKFFKLKYYDPYYKLFDKLINNLSSHIIKRTNNNILSKINILLKKILKKFDYSLIANIIVKSSNSNYDIIKSILQINNILIQYKFNDSVFLDKQKWITNKLIDIIKFYNYDKIIDIGGGEGNILNFIGNELKINKENLICIEQQNDWDEKYSFNNSNITYLFWDNINIDIQPNSIDIIIIMVTIHHMSDDTIKHLMININKIIKKNGLVIIKEHDCNSDITKKIIDWEHHLYHIIRSNNLNEDNITKYIDGFINNYKSKEYFTKLFEFNNFKNIKTMNRFFDDFNGFDASNPTNLYWDVFKKN